MVYYHPGIVEEMMKTAVNQLAINILRRVQADRRPWTCNTMRQLLWNSVLGLIATARTLSEIKECESTYAHICDTYLYPPHDVFYAGDAAYTVALMAVERGVGQPTPTAFKAAAGNPRNEK